MKTHQKITSVFAALFFLTSCSASKPDGSATSASEKAVAALGCEDFESQIWDAIHDDVGSAKGLNESAAKEMLAKTLEERQLQNSQLSQSLNQLVHLLYSGVPEAIKTSDKYQLFQAYAALELNAKVKELDGVAAELKKEITSIQAQTEALGIQCPQKTTKKTRAFKVNSALWGGKKVFATAYQSCEALRKPAMVESTPDVEGIVINGTHPDGVGKKRYISDVNLVNKTHYYIQGMQYPSSCLDIRKSPLIYDYGGKPWASGSGTDAIMSFFRNAGDGTGVLGFDCSGFVSAALLASGLKFRSNVEPKAQSASAYSSHSFLNPEDNFDCLKRITVTPVQSIKDGDIVAVAGHVVMLDEVGSDPFGFANFTSASSCDNITVQKFNFTIVQSSNSKNGIGLNRFRASHYLAEKETLKTGLISYAKTACRAKFSGATSTPSLSTLSIIRHTGSSQCVGKPVVLESESCTNSCVL